MGKERRADETGIRREALIQARMRCGISRSELADRLKLSRTSIYRVEQGLRRPKLTTMVRWADALNATMDIFRDDADLAA